MGAGTDPAGSEMAGSDACPRSAATLAVTRGPMRFDLVTRTYLLGADNRVLTTHWVDQAVSLVLSTERGTFKGDATFGLDLEKLRRAAPVKIQGITESIVKQSLEMLVKRKDIRITTIIGEKIGYAIYITVEYDNLRLNTGRKQKFQRTT